MSDRLRQPESVEVMVTHTRNLELGQDFVFEGHDTVYKIISKTEKSITIKPTGVKLGKMAAHL